MGETAGVILPIILVLGLGFFCRKKNLVSEAGIEGIKKVSVSFLWPMVLFYAFFTAQYGETTVLYAGVNFLANVIAFITGLLIRKRVKEHAFSWPYLLSGFETGMIGYAMYTLLYGSENISYLALLDVGHALFIFPIFLSCLNYEQGEGDLTASFRNMIASPIMIALIIGMFSGLTGFGGLVMRSWTGAVINKLYTMASSANVVMILIAMGYNIQFSVRQVKESIKVILVRMSIMTACATAGIALIRQFVPLNDTLVSAVIVTFIMPPVYMLSVYVKNREENEFMSTTSSVYTVLTIIAFLVMTIAMKA